VPIFASTIPIFNKRVSHIKNDPLKPLTEHISEMKNIRIVSKPDTTITNAYYYNDNVYLAKGFYANTCLCGESSSGAQCQKYVVEPTVSDNTIPVTINIFNATDCSKPADITYKFVVPSSGVSKVGFDCDAGADLIELPYKIQVGDVNAYESFGSGDLSFLYGRQEDCAENLFNSYSFFAFLKCGYGPMVVCAQNSTYEVLDSFSVRITLYSDNQCDTVTNTFEYSSKDQQCQPLSEQDDSEMSNFSTIMFQQ